MKPPFLLVKNSIFCRLNRLCKAHGVAAGTASAAAAAAAFARKRSGICGVVGMIWLWNTERIGIFPRFLAICWNDSGLEYWNTSVQEDFFHCDDGDNSEMTQEKRDRQTDSCSLWEPTTLDTPNRPGIFIWGLLKPVTTIFRGIHIY